MTELLPPPSQPPTSFPSPTSTLSTASNQASAALTRLQLKRCHDETWSTFASFLLPTLETRLEEVTKISALTRSLKKLRKRRRSLREMNTRGAGPDTVSNLDTSADIESSGGSGDGSAGRSAGRSDVDRTRRRTNREEADIWKKIQTKTITRMISTVYTHAFLYLVLWAQVRILGGRLHLQRARRRLREERGETKDDHARTDSDGDEFDSHRAVLTRTFRTFFSDGVPEIVRKVEAVAEVMLRDWNVIVEEDEEEKKGSDHGDADARGTTTLGCISVEDLENVLERIRSSFETEVVNGSVEVDGDGTTPCSFLISLFAPTATDSTIAEETTDTDTAGHILNETWDLLESPVWKEVERECLGASFDTLRNGSGGTHAPMEGGVGGWSELFTPKWNGGGAEGGPRDGAEDDGGLEESVPLAYVLTQLKKVTQKSFYTQVTTGDAFDVRAATTSCPNVYVREIERLPSLQELGDACFNSYY